MGCSRFLYEKNYSRQDIINLFRFVDWSMRLPEPEEQAFWRELAEYEEEKRMPYITSVEKMGLERGIAIGEARVIASKFGLTTENDAVP